MVEEVHTLSSAHIEIRYTEVVFNGFWPYVVSLKELLDVDKSSVSAYMMVNTFDGFSYGIRIGDESENVADNAEIEFSCDWDMKKHCGKYMCM